MTMTITPVSVREAKFRLILQHNNSARLVASHGAQALLGFSDEDFLSGRTCLPQLIHADDLDIAELLFAHQSPINDGDCNLRLRQANGRVLCVKGHYHRQHSGDDVILDLLLQDARSLPRTMEDITILSSYVVILETADDYIYFKDRNHVFTGASQSLVSLCEPVQHWTDFIGLTDYDVFPEEYADAYYRLEKNVFAKLTASREIQETLNVDGTKGWVDNRKYPIRDKNGIVTGLYGIARDISTQKQTESNLLHAKKALDEAQALSQLGSWELDLISNHLTWSEQIFRIFEIDPTQFSGTYEAFLDAIHPDDRDAVDQVYTNSIKHRTPYEITHRLRFNDGRVKWVTEKCVSEFDSDGKPLRSFGTVQDISDRVVLDQERGIALELLERTGSVANVGGWALDLDTMKLSWTRETFRISEMDPNQPPRVEEAINLYAPEARPTIEAAVKNLIDSGIPYDLELPFITAKGTHKWIRTQGYCESVDGRIVRIFGTFQDITNQRDVQEALRQNEERWRFAIEGSGDGLWDWNVPKNTVLFSKRWKEMLGYAEHEVSSSMEEWSKRLHPEDLSRAMAELQAHLDGHTAHYVSEHRLLCKDGTWKWILDRGLVVARDANGAALRVIGTQSDIDRRVRAQQELREIKDSLSEAQRIAHMGSWELDTRAGKISWSEEIYRVFLMDPEGPEPSLSDSEKLLIPESWISLRAAASQAIETGKNFELEVGIIRQDASSGWLWIRGEVMRDEPGAATGLRGIALDISARRAAQDEIKGLGSRLSATLRALPDMMFEISGDGLILQYHSDIVADELLIPPQELIGQNVKEVLPAHAVQSVFSAMKEIHDRGRSSGQEYSLMTNRGRRVYEISGSSIEQAGVEQRYILLVRDITLRHLSQQRAQRLMELAAISVDVDDKVLAQKALDFLEELTQSKIGFVHLVSDDQQEIELMAWSAATLSTYCHAAYDNHYPVDKAGIWADSIRTRAPVIVNDYSRAENKKGLPEGHSRLDRLISVPWEEDGKVRMVIGIGNAEFDYDEDAVNTARLFCGELYHMIQRNRNQRALQLSEHFLRESQQLAHLGSWELNLLSDEFTWSDELARIYGADPAMPPPTFTEQKKFIQEQSWEKFKAAIDQTTTTGMPCELELNIVRTDGSQGWLWVRAQAQRDSQGTTTGLRGVALDISPLKQAEASITQLSDYDTLTALANRQHLYRVLQNTVNNHLNKKLIGGLIMVNLDNFKIINETMGHDAGDELLVQISNRLKDCVHYGDFVARYGGDEFVLVLSQLGDTPLQASLALNTAAEKILGRLKGTYLLDNGDYFTTASMGLTLFGDTDMQSIELIKQLSIALFEAKKKRGNSISFFDADMQTLVNDSAQMIIDLRRGIERHEFEMYYQAQLDKFSSIIGAEALVRWNHPTRGLLSPADFISAAETHDLMVTLGEEILQMCLAQLRRWQDSNEFRHLKISINITADQFYTAAAGGFAEHLESLISDYRLDPSSIMLEFTESMLLGNIELARAIINRLNEKGIRFAIDDFGTGYSSLAYLSELPMDQLKIDQSFVRNIGRKAKDEAIVRAIIDMASTLDMTVLAEGVENAVQRKYLLQHGCEYFQGYLFSRPLPIEQFNALVKQRGTISG